MPEFSKLVVASEVSFSFVFFGFISLDQFSLRRASCCAERERKGQLGGKGRDNSALARSQRVMKVDMDIWGSSDGLRCFLHHTHDKKEKIQFWRSFGQTYSLLP